MCETLLNDLGIKDEQNTVSKGAHSIVRETDKKISKFQNNITHAMRDLCLGTYSLHSHFSQL